MAILAAAARVVLSAVVACSFACCCGAASLGVPCVDSAARQDGGGVAVVSPALECRSRLCLVTKEEGGTTALCTVECSSDHDCAGAVSLYCRDGSVCATVAGFPRNVCTCR